MNVHRIDPRARRGGRRRGGYTLVELALSLLVLLAAMGVTVRVLGTVGKDRRAADRRQWAVQAVANVMERVTAGPFERVTSGYANRIADGTGAAGFLPGAAWEVAVDEVKEPVAGKRVTLRLRWKETGVGLSGPVRLTAWVYPRRAPS